MNHNDQDNQLDMDKLINAVQDLKLKPKFSTSVKLITNTSSATQRINPTIPLSPEKVYKAALTSFSTFNSIKNVNANKNDKLRVSKDSGKTWQTITIRPGSYEIASIDREIKRQLGVGIKDEKKLNLKVEVTVNRISLTLDATHQVDFNVPGTIASLLGFEKKLYKEGYHIGEFLPKITDVNSIVIHCDITEGGYLNGAISNAIYSFPSFKVGIGYKMNEQPSVLQFFPITKPVIDLIRVWVTDEKGTPLEFGGEDVVIDIMIKEV